MYRATVVLLLMCSVSNHYTSALQCYFCAAHEVMSSNSFTTMVETRLDRIPELLDLEANEMCLSNEARDLNTLQHVTECGTVGKCALFNITLVSDSDKLDIHLVIRTCINTSSADGCNSSSRTADDDVNFYLAELERIYHVESSADSCLCSSFDRCNINQEAMERTTTGSTTVVVSSALALYMDISIILLFLFHWSL